MHEYNYTDLPILSWNMHGLFRQYSGFRDNKLHSPYFLDVIKGVKIFSLIETNHMASEIDQIQLAGYKCYNACRKKRPRGRNSGGIAVYIDTSLLDGVQKIPSTGSENILIKLKKDFFGLSRDIVICFSYCVPENSSYQKREQLDVYGDIEKKLSSLGQGVDIMCFGDFNARTGIKLDYLESEDNTDIPVPLDIYETDSVNVLPRLNRDCKTNTYGDKLLSLCKTVPLRICNGRKLGDILGSYTCHTPNGQSCVDYCMASPKLYDSVKTLNVGEPLLTLSDHCPVTAVLKVKINSRITNGPAYDFLEKPTKLKWNKEISYKFENILQSPEFKAKFESFISGDIDNTQSDIDRATIEISTLIVEGAIKADTSAVQKPNAGQKVLKKAGGRHKVFKKQPLFPKWHDLSCCEAHRKVYTTARLLKSDPDNRYLRSKLRLVTKDYNKLVKSKQKQFVENMFVELDSMENDNPRGYMQLINSMREGNFDRNTPDDTSEVSPSNWHSHFNELLTKTSESKTNDQLLEFIDQNIDVFKSKLDDQFSIKKL